MQILHKLVDIQYQRNDINFIRGTFRVRGDIVEIFPVANNERLFESSCSVMRSSGSLKLMY